MYSLASLASFRSGLSARLPKFLRDDESGQGMVEYAFILVLIALVVIVTLMVVGNQVSNYWSNIAVGMKHANG